MAREPKNGDCQRCGAEGSWLVTEFSITMSEVYNAFLCIDCRNDWDAYIVGQPARNARFKNADDMNMAWAMTCADGLDRSEQMAALRDEWNTLNQVLRDLAIAWVAETITR